MNRELTIHDAMPFGKHTGVTILALLEDNPSYLCWLRDERKAEGKPTPFCKDVLARLDRKIAGSKRLQQKHLVWDLNNVEIDEPVTGPIAQSPADQPTQKDVPETADAYRGAWGAY